MSFGLKCEQRRLGPRSLFVCILAIELVAILAIDMYAPALPSMHRSFDVGVGYLNLTMFAFFFMSAFSTFFTGPASDCFGRKPLLTACVALFALSSAACAIAPSVEALIVFRICQGIGVGGIQTLATALIQDSYDDDSVQTAMTFLQSLVIVGPVLAPFLGTFVLLFTDWRGIFGLLAACGAVSFVLSLLIEETHKVDLRAGKSLANMVRKVAGDCRLLVRDRSFTSLALIMGVAGMPFFAFIAVVSYILIDFFAMDYLGYSVIYALSCLINCIAPFVYMALSKRLGYKRILRLCLVLVAVSAAGMLAVGSLTPALFFIAFVPYALAEGVVRPLSYVELLDQPQDRVGSASSLVNFSYSIITAVATVVATLEWPTLVFGLGAVSAATALLMVVLYAWGQRDGQKG